MAFEQKVRNMTAKEIIMAMVNGLKKQHVNVDMLSFGHEQDGICFGCAATNAACEISGKNYGSGDIHGKELRSIHMGCSRRFLSDFEMAIDELRKGNVFLFNHYARRIGIATIKIKVLNFELPRLNTDNYLENLHYYEKLAELQD